MAVCPPADLTRMSSFFGDFQHIFDVAILKNENVHTINLTHCTQLIILCQTS